MPAVFKTQLGTGLATASSTTVTITTTAAIDVGDTVVVRVAADNLNASTPTFTCADGSANVYTNRAQGAVNATAAAGVAGAIFTCKATAFRASGSTITVTLSGAVAHKSAMATSYTQVDTNVRSTAVSTTGTATAASAGASGTVNAGDLVLGTIANETRGTITMDSDTTNGVWSAQVVSRSATSGTDTACVTVAGQHKIPNAAGAQTYNVTAVASEWWMATVVMQAAIGYGTGFAAHDWTCAGGALGKKTPKGTATVNWANTVTAAGSNAPGATTIVASTLAGGAGVSSVNVPAGGATGDKYAIIIHNQARTSSTPPTFGATGFEAVGTVTGTNDPAHGDWWYGGVLVKPWDGSSGSFAVTGLGGTWTYLECLLLRGAVSFVKGDYAQGAGGSLTLPGVSPSAGNTLGLICGCDWDATTWSASGWASYMTGPSNAGPVLTKTLAAGATGSIAVSSTSVTRHTGFVLGALNVAAPPPSTGPAWTYDFTDDADGPMPSSLVLGNGLEGVIVSGHFQCVVDWYFTKVYDTLVTQTDPQHLMAVETTFITSGSKLTLYWAGDATVSAYSGVEIFATGMWVGIQEQGGNGGSGNLGAFSLGVPTKIHATFNQTTAAIEVFVNDVSKVTFTQSGGKIGTRGGFQIGGNLDNNVTKYYYGAQSAGVPGAGGGGGGGGTGTATVSWAMAVAAVGPTAVQKLWKGVGSVSRANLIPELGLVGVSWYYDWASYSVIVDSKYPFPTPGVEYVPMMWGDWDRTYAGFDVGGTPAESIGPATVLLGFNEPNITEQSDMTVARCRALWPQLEATGARLGSPAMSPNAGAEAYLDAFLADTSGYQPHVDFICAHWYTEYDAGYSNIGGYLDYLHTRYGKPIWVTEVGTLSGGQSANAALMPTVFAALATRPWVERVAWYALQENGWTNTNLVTPTPALTTAGTQYATYDNVIGAQAGGAGLTWTIVPAATGTRTAKGIATAAHSWVSAGAGKRTPKGASTTTYAEAVAAAGKRDPKASAVTQYAETLSVTSKRTPKSTATINNTWVVAATGAMPVVGQKQGSAIVAYIEAVAGAGKRAPKAAATVTYTEAVTAAGSKPTKGTATTQWTAVPAAAGKKTPKGAVTTTALQSVAATGKRTPKGQADTGFFIYQLAAQGVAPTVGVRQGTGTTSVLWVPVALGKKPSKGGNAVMYVFAVVAVGMRLQKGVAATSYLDTVAAAGKRAPKGSNSVAVTFATAAVGKKAPKGVGTGPLSYAYAVAAAGVAPIVGFNDGFGTITNTWATAAVGKKTPKGSRTINNTFNPVALGKKIQKAVATIAYVYATAAAGNKAPKSVLVVYYIEVTTAAGTRASRGRADPTYRYSPAAAGVSGIISGQVHGEWNGNDFVAMQLGNKAVIDWLMIPS